VTIGRPKLKGRVEALETAVADLATKFTVMVTHIDALRAEVKGWASQILHSTSATEQMRTGANEAQQHDEAQRDDVQHEPQHDEAHNPQAEGGSDLRPPFMQRNEHDRDAA
jgi:DNA-binding FrmR family transcriptional regulator